MKVELTRIRIKDGMSPRVDEWFSTLNARKAECVETLEREKMFVETIFREKIGDEEFLYWFSIQGENGESIETSPFPIDTIHRTLPRSEHRQTQVSHTKHDEKSQGGSY